MNWRALLLRCLGIGAVLIGVSLYSVFGPTLFQRGEPEDWRERTAGGLRFNAPAPLTRSEIKGVESGRGVDVEQYADDRKSVAVQVFHLRVALPIRTPEQHFESEEKNLRAAMESVAKNVVCYPIELTVSEIPARRFVCTGETNPGFLRIESLVISNEWEM